MKTSTPIADVHLYFAEYFFQNELKHYAYLVSKKLEEGHICVSLDDVINSKTLTNTDPVYLSSLRERLFNNGLIKPKEGSRQPFVIHNQRLYLQRYFHYETLILNCIKSFLKAEQAEYDHRVASLNKHKDFIESLFIPVEKKSYTNNTVDWQLAAAISCVLNNFTIITGGPGTGKTTTVAKILAILFTLEADLKVALAAPTGKAAARMAESLQNAKLPVDEKVKERFKALIPSTIHRLLKKLPDSPYFQHNRNNILPYDLIIIDESSMIEVALFAKLLDAIGPHTRIIMLGDKDQLASVEAGSLFGDLCGAQATLNNFTEERVNLINSFTTDFNAHIDSRYKSHSNEHPLFQHIIELRHSHRFNGEAGIGKFSKAVINNDTKVIHEFCKPDADCQVLIDPDYSAILFESFVSRYKEAIQEKDTLTALRKFNKLKILCAMREGDQGLYAINKKIEDFLHRKNIITKTGEYYENRPIIVNRNYYNLGLFNGDVGLIRYDANGTLRAWFEDGQGGLKSVLPGYLTNCETVFAMTIHKSQGSEFDEVMVILPSSAGIPILTRELLYTAITRAKLKVIIQGTKEVITKAAEAYVKRGSGIIERFEE